jgi:short subunit dehydrogenase-like uncharacterized protein
MLRSDITGETDFFELIKSAFSKRAAAKLLQ